MHYQTSGTSHLLRAPFEHVNLSRVRPSALFEVCKVGHHRNQVEQSLFPTIEILPNIFMYDLWMLLILIESILDLYGDNFLLVR